MLPLQTADHRPIPRHISSLQWTRNSRGPTFVPTRALTLLDVPWRYLTRIPLSLLTPRFLKSRITLPLTISLSRQKAVIGHRISVCTTQHLPTSPITRMLSLRRRHLHCINPHFHLVTLIRPFRLLAHPALVADSQLFFRGTTAQPN